MQKTIRNNASPIMKLTTTRRVLLCGVIAFTALAVTRSARADYSNTVMSMNPIMYYHLNETASVPIADQAANLGSLGAVVNGFYATRLFRGDG